MCNLDWINDPPLTISEQDYFERLQQIYGAENVVRVEDGVISIKKPKEETDGELDS